MILEVATIADLWPSYGLIQATAGVGTASILSCGHQCVGRCYRLVQATVGVGTASIWALCAAWTGEGAPPVDGMWKHAHAGVVGGRGGLMVSVVAGSACGLLLVLLCCGHGAAAALALSVNVHWTFTGALPAHAPCAAFGTFI